MLSLSQVQTHESSWDPNTAQVTLNTRLDARLVPHGSGMRLDYGHVVVLDNFIDEPQRQALLDLLTKPEWEHSEGPPTDKWERETADGAGLPKTWGLKDSVLQKLAKGDMPAMQEVHTRLAKLYPDFTIAHMPSDMIQHRTAAASDNDDVVPGSPGPSQVADTSLNNALRHGDLRLPQIDATLQSSQCQTESGSHQAQPPSRSGSDDESVAEPSVDCNQFVGNAAVYGDCYTWHVDADPSAFPASPWVDTFGHYCNGDPGRPLLVSLLLYLDDRWPRQWDAETLFLDDDTDIGIVVRPKCYRAVLMDQDVLHRVSTPSQLAGARPRYSLVWKLVFMPKTAVQQCCIAKPAWGAPTAIGSAAKIQSIQRAMLLKRKSEVHQAELQT